MKKYLLSLSICLFNLTLFAQTFDWAKSAGGNSNNDNGRAVATDMAGNVYVTGNFSGTADFDPSASTFNLTAVGLIDIFIQKLDASGNLVWAVAVGGSQEDIGNGIVVDQSTGDVFMVGQFRGVADFDPSAATSNFTSNGNYDICVLKLNSLGNFQWARTFGGTGWDYGIACTLDGAGNLINTGVFQNNADLDPTVGTTNVTSFGLNDTYIQKLSASGSLIWVKRLGGSLHDDAWSVATDNNNNIYVSGAFQGTCDFDPSPSSLNLSSNGDFDVYILKLDANGNFTWAKSLGGSGTDKGFSIGVNSLGNAFITGYFNQSVDFDPSANNFNISSTGMEDIFVLELNTSGNFVWAKSMGGIGSDIATGIAVDGGNISVTGQFKNSVDFDPSTAIVSLSSLGDYDAFLLNLDIQGNFMFVKQVGSIGSDFGRNVTMKQGGIFVTGSYTGNVDFDMDGLGLILNSSNGSTDIYTQKYSIDQFSIDDNILSFGNIFPNPTKEKLNIDFLNIVNNASISIYNQNGQAIRKIEHINGNAISLDVSSFSNGLYYIVLYDNGKPITMKFIKD